MTSTANCKQLDRYRLNNELITKLQISGADFIHYIFISKVFEENMNTTQRLIFTMKTASTLHILSVIITQMQMIHSILITSTYQQHAPVNKSV